MLVYRIENERGVGAFRAGFAKVHDAAVKGDTYRSCYDGQAGYHLDGLTEHHFFGSASIGALQTWFFSPEGCASIAAKGGVLVTYEVDPEHVLYGQLQVAFIRSQATEVSRVPANQLHS